MSTYAKAVVWWISAVCVLVFLLLVVAWRHPSKAADLSKIYPQRREQRNSDTGSVERHCSGEVQHQQPQNHAQPLQPPSPHTYQPPPPVYQQPPAQGYGPPAPSVYGPGIYINPGAGIYQFGPVIIHAPPVVVPVPQVQAPIPANPNPIGFVVWRFVQCDTYGQNCFISVPADAANVRVSPGGEITGALINGVPVTVLGRAGYWLAIQVTCQLTRTGLFSDTAGGVPLLGCQQ